MKFKDYKFDSASESIELTYQQAKSYFEETLDYIKNSKFDLFNDDEELTLEQAQEKYNEINRRLQTFGQSFELFMKYIIHASRLEKNPNITIDELWNKWIRGHQMIPLINEKANSPEVLPNFKEIFNLSLNSYYGVYGWNYRRRIGFEGINRKIEPLELLLALQPQTYYGQGTMSDEEIEKIIDKNSAIYEKCRYNIQKMTNYDFGEVFQFINFIGFFAKMIYLSKNKTEIDYNVAYVHAMASDPILYELLKTIKTEKEIQAILNDEFYNKDAQLLSYILTQNNYSLDDINNIRKLNKQFENPNNLYTFLTYNIPIKYINICNEKGYDVMLLASDFSFEQIEKLINIPIVGKYLNENSALVNRMITVHKSDVGLSFDDWYRVLSLDALKREPSALKKIISKYMEAYHCSEKNKLCNSIFSESGSINQPLIAERKTFSQRYSDFIISNIEKNSDYFKEFGISSEALPLSIDNENIKRIMSLFQKNGISSISPTLLVYPYNEILAVVNYMKSTGYNLNSKTFQSDFWKIYDEHAPYDMLLRDNFLLDEFIEQNGLVRICDRRYSAARYGTVIEANHNNPLPNMKK